MRTRVTCCLVLLALPCVLWARSVGEIERPGEGVWPLASGIHGDVEEIVILHTSDVHGYTFERDELRPGEDEHVGGLFSLATLVESLRRELWLRRPEEAIRFARTGADDGILLLDAGDAVSGTYDDFLSQGANTVRVQNAPFLDYDVMTIGNHSSDHGVEAMLRNVAARRQAVVLCNVFSDDAARRPLPGTVPWVVRNIRGIRVGIFGLTHEYSTRFDGYRVGKAVDAARRVLPELRKRCDLVICLAHLGLDYDKERWVRKELAALDDEDPAFNIDLIVDGHSHGNVSFLLDEDTLVVQAGRYGVRAGEVRLRIDRETKRPFEAVVRRHELDATKLIPSDRLRRNMQKLVDEVRGENEQVLVEGLDGMFFSKTPRDSSRLENPASDFVVRSVWEELRDDEGHGPDVAVAYQKGIRNDVAANDRGQVTAGILHQILPFGEKLNMLGVTGQQLRDLVERGLIKKFSWAGIRARYHEGRDEKGQFQRTLVDLKVWNRATSSWEAVEVEKIYRMACVSFFARVFVAKGASSVQELSVTNKEIFEAFLRRYVKKRGLVFGDRDPLYPNLIQD